MAKPVTIHPKSIPEGLKIELFNKTGKVFLRVTRKELKLLIPVSEEKLVEFKQLLISGNDGEYIRFVDPKKPEHSVYFTVNSKVRKWIHLNIYEGDSILTAFISERRIQMLLKFF